MIPICRILRDVVVFNVLPLPVVLVNVPAIHPVALPRAQPVEADRARSSSETAVHFAGDHALTFPARSLAWTAKQYR